MSSSPTMITNRVMLEIGSIVSFLPQRLGYVNTIIINLHGEIEELIEDQNGIVTQLGSYLAPPVSPIRLQPRNLNPRHISQLLNQTITDIDFCQILAERIARDCSFFTGPLMLSVMVKATREIRVMLPSVAAPLKVSASDYVLRRLVEEQSVVFEREEEEVTCSICMEDLSESSSESHENIIKLPDCLHLFHQGCLFEWLKRQNSCPLCRRVPYDDEDQETEETQILV